MTEERRRSERHRIAIPVWLKDAQGGERTLTADVSAHGLTVVSPRPRGLRQYVELELTLPSPAVTIGVTAKVIRQAELSRSQSDGPESGFGLEFYLFDASAKGHWLRFLGELRRGELSASAPRRALLAGPHEPTEPSAREAAPARAPAPPADDGPPSFIVKPRDLGRLWAFFRGELARGRVRLESPVLKEVGTPAEIVVVHPGSGAEHLLGATVAESAWARGGRAVLELSVDALGERGLAAFREFITSGRAPEPATAPGARELDGEEERAPTVIAGVPAPEAPSFDAAEESSAAQRRVGFEDEESSAAHRAAGFDEEGTVAEVDSGDEPETPSAAPRTPPRPSLFSAFFEEAGLSAASSLPEPARPPPLPARGVRLPQEARLPATGATTEPGGQEALLEPGMIAGPRVAPPEPSPPAPPPLPARAPEPRAASAGSASVARAAARRGPALPDWVVVRRAAPPRPPSSYPGLALASAEPPELSPSGLIPLDGPLAAEEPATDGRAPSFTARPISVTAQRGEALLPGVPSEAPIPGRVLDFGAEGALEAPSLVGPLASFGARARPAPASLPAARPPPPRTKPPRSPVERERASHKNVSTEGTNPELDRSIALARARMVRSPESATAHLRLGSLLALRPGAAPLDEALEALERAAKLKPDHAGAQHQLAELLARRGEYRRAFEHLERARQLGHPLDPELERTVAAGVRGT